MVEKEVKEPEAKRRYAGYWSVALPILLIVVIGIAVYYFVL